MARTPGSGNSPHGLPPAGVKRPPEPATQGGPDPKIEGDTPGAEHDEGMSGPEAESDQAGSGRVTPIP